MWDLGENAGLGMIITDLSSENSPRMEEIILKREGEKEKEQT